MSIVKAITDQRNPALVSKMQGKFEEYQGIRRRSVEFSPSFSPELESLDDKLRKFCTAIPEMQKEAKTSTEASAYFYAGLVKALSIGEQAVALITKEIAHLEKELYAAIDAKLERQEMAALEERRRQQAEEAQREWKEKKRKETAARKARKKTFCCLYWLVGIALAWAYLALNNDGYWGLGLVLFAVFCGVAGVFVLEKTLNEEGGFMSFIWFLIGAVGALICGGAGHLLAGDDGIGIIGGAVLWLPALIVLFATIMNYGKERRDWWD
jgi:cation transport ATPase